jgi:hypothetical protein
MAYSLVMAGEICSVLHTKDENKNWWRVRRLPLLAAEPANNAFFVFAMESKVPGGNVHDFWS